MIGKLTVGTSPVVRRVRKSVPTSPGQPAPHAVHMVKSASMGNVSEQPQPAPVATPPVTTDSEECADPATTDHSTSNDPASFHEVKKTVGGNGSGSMSASCDTLPRTFSRGKSISRSLVPKMRKFFEKSRSADPEMPQVKILIHTEPNTGNRTPPARVSDGTESARSSFVLLGPGDADSRDQVSSNSISGSNLSLDDDQEDIGKGEKQKGFVNKCVTKVKSFMGKSQELEK